MIHTYIYIDIDRVPEMKIKVLYMYMYVYSTSIGPMGSSKDSYCKILKDCIDMYRWYLHLNLISRIIRIIRTDG